MAKTVIAKTITFALTGKNSNVFFQIDAPMCYTLYDMVQIIKMYAQYSNKYAWKFVNEYNDAKTLNNVADEVLDAVKFDEYRDITPAILCFYDNLEIKISVRGHLKYTKVYPTIYQAVGFFPPEEELSKDMESSNDKPPTKEELKDFDEKLKSYFKSKYKITDEIVSSFFGEQNNLARK